MRTFLRIVLLAWWIVPVWWLVVWPLIALMGGPKMATESLIDLTIFAFKGMEE